MGANFLPFSLFVGVSECGCKSVTYSPPSASSLSQEASLMRSLQHDSVVRIFGVCLDPTSIVMELMEESLHSRIRRFPGLPSPLS